MSLRSILTITAICLAGTLQAQDQKPKALALVKEAVAFAKKNGKEALLKETNQGQGRFHVKSGDDLYIFIYDPDGKLFLQEMISLAKTKGSGWVDYKYPNPKSGKIEAKTSYVEFLDGWMVGCGIYK